MKSDTLLVLGCALIAYGVYMWSVPAGVIVAGIFLASAGVADGIRSTKKPEKPGT